MKKTAMDRSIPCVVELPNVSGVFTGTARILESNTARIEFPAIEGSSDLHDGDLIGFSASSPIRAVGVKTRISSVSAGVSSIGRPMISALINLPMVIEPQPRESRTGRVLEQSVVLALGLEYVLCEDSGNQISFVEAHNSAEALDYLAKKDVDVLVLGPRESAHQRYEILSRCCADCSERKMLNIIVGVGADIGLFQSFVDEDHVFYLSGGRLEQSELLDLVVAAIDCLRMNRESGKELAAQTPFSEILLDVSTRLETQEDLPNAVGLLAEAAGILTHAKRCECLIYDRAQDVLWSSLTNDTANAEGRNISAAAGLIGYVARTGKRVQLERVGADPRYEKEADNPGGDDKDRFLVEPIPGVDREVMGPIVGMVVATRDFGDAPFSSEDVHMLKLLIAHAASRINAIDQQDRIQAALLKRARGSLDVAEIFRQEALDENNRGGDQLGPLLVGRPLWLRWSHLLMVLLLIGGVIFFALTRTEEYAIGPAVIRAVGRFEISAPTSGVVASIESPPGTRVNAAQPIARFDISPGQQLDILAPANGIIGNVFVGRGQHLMPGEKVANLFSEDLGYELVALMPGSYAPLLHQGMQLILKLHGYPDSREISHIDQVGMQILGPRDTTQYVAEGLAVSGPIVVVRSRLPGSKFNSRDSSLEYRDGMTGDAEIGIRSSSMIVKLLPGLESLR